MRNPLDLFFSHFLYLFFRFHFYKYIHFLMQLHNPYLATPMSISSYRMATSPSDQNNKDILAWLDRLQDSVRKTGENQKPSPNPDTAVRAQQAEQQQDDTDEDAAAASPDQERDADADAGADDADADAADAEEALQNQSLPDAAVPLGLIANLSLSSNKG